MTTPDRSPEYPDDFCGPCLSASAVQRIHDHHLQGGEVPEAQPLAKLAAVEAHHLHWSTVLPIEDPCQDHLLTRALVYMRHFISFSSKHCIHFSLHCFMLVHSTKNKDIELWLSLVLIPTTSRPREISNERRPLRSSTPTPRFFSRIPANRLPAYPSKGTGLRLNLYFLAPLCYRDLVVPPP